MYGRRGSLWVSDSFDTTNRQPLTDHLTRNICPDELQQSRVVDSTGSQRSGVCSVFEYRRHGLEYRCTGGVVGFNVGGHRVGVGVRLGKCVCVVRVELSSIGIR